MNKIYERLLEYHNRTKHLPDRYAPSPGYLDWATQPNPFRFYRDAPRLNLPLVEDGHDQPYTALYEQSDQMKIDLDSIAALLELSLGLSAWKQYQGSSWSLRMNPSSGNLHPTECHLILPAVGDREACITHYGPFLHCLEHRADLAVDAANTMPAGFGLILSSIYWREAWKYGERAFRYVNHDLGHAMAALRYAASLLGWQITLCPQVEAEKLNLILGFDQFQMPEDEVEDADCLLWVSLQDIDSEIVVEWLSDIVSPDYSHIPNTLSSDHRSWPVIGQVAELVRSPGFSLEKIAVQVTGPPGNSEFKAQEIIRKRRSAQSYDPSASSISLDGFRQILQATLPADRSPFDVMGLEAQVSLFLFVHQVEGLDAGLYCLVRNSKHMEELKLTLKSGFTWQSVDNELPLYLLEKGDYRATAEMISCQQAIAGDSAFSLGMLARFESVLETAPWRYPSLYWETGIIGQVLYLEAEANNLQGTGIGCFFDDLMHELLGIKDQSWQDLYHFTIGSALVDTRIQTLPPYFHLESMRNTDME